MKKTIKYRLTIEVEVIDDSRAHREMIDLAIAIDDGSASEDLLGINGRKQGLMNVELSLIKIDINE